MTQPKDIEGLRKVAEEATPGPWEVWPYGDPRVVNSEIGWTIYTNEDPDEAQRPQLDANARYIAAASPDVVLALLSELEAVKGELENTKYVLEEIRAAHDVSVELHLAAEAALEAVKGENARLETEVLNAAFSDRLDMEAGGSPLTWKEIALSAEAALVSLKGGGGSSRDQSPTTCRGDACGATERAEG